MRSPTRKKPSTVVANYWVLLESLFKKTLGSF